MAKYKSKYKGSQVDAALGLFIDKLGSISYVMQIGSNGRPVWNSIPAPTNIPLSNTTGDLPIDRLANLAGYGTDGQVLGTDGNSLVWVTVGGGGGGSVEGIEIDGDVYTADDFGNVNLPKASATTSGYLDLLDYETFANKQNALSTDQIGYINDVPNKLDKLNNKPTSGTYTKLAINGEGQVTGGENLIASDIPDIDASQVASGQFDIARIPSIPVSLVTGLGSLATKSSVSWTTEVTNKPSSLSGYGIPNIDWGTQIDNKPTTVAGYGITDVYTSTEVDSKIAAEDESIKTYIGQQGFELASNKKDISSSAGVGEYPTSTSVWSALQDIIATIPAGGLKVPINLDKESDLPTSGQQDGDYYFIQDMDILAPGRTGRAWWNSTATTPGWQKVYDQYQTMDGVSITQTGAGSWEVSLEWLHANAVPLTRSIAGLALTGDITAAQLKSALSLTADDIPTLPVSKISGLGALATQDNLTLDQLTTLMLQYPNLD